MSVAGLATATFVKSATTDRHERPKDFLTPPEVERLLDATKGSRYRIRDRAIFLTMFRHGLRVSELCGLRRDDFDPDQARLWVRRLKSGRSTDQPVEGDAQGRQPAVAVRYGARWAVHSPGDQLMRLRLGEQGSGFARDPGLARAQACADDGALHAHGRDPVRGVVVMIPPRNGVELAFVLFVVLPLAVTVLAGAGALWLAWLFKLL
jgi:hypothetical protein